MRERRPPLVIVAGPTGVGKTAAAVALARLLPIEVVSADSRQVYRGMDVATGKPTAEELAAVPHHLVDVVDPDDRYDAARFRRDARAAIAAIRARGGQPVVVGGTGLYIRALVRGLDPAPPADPGFREELAGLARRQGRPALHARLTAEAPELARRLHPNDHVRVVRALERLRAGGTTAVAEAAWQRPEGEEYQVVSVGLTLDRAALAERLRRRAAAMAAGGLLPEVRRLLAAGHAPELPAMQGIGYRQFIAVARGSLGREEALRQMQRDTVRYARRQWTWFQGEPGMVWIDVAAVGGPAGVAELIRDRMREGGVTE